MSSADRKRRARGEAGLEEPVRRLPRLPGAVVFEPDADDLLDRLAADLVVHAENCVRQFGDFHLALSAGPGFEALYRRLMYDPNCRRLPWRRTHLWLAHEEKVPLNDERSSSRMISDLIGDHADIPSEQFHPVFAESETAASDYEAQLREALAWREKGQDRLDYVLLTAGDDGRTAGILPGASPADDDDARLVRGGAGSVTLTAGFINASRFVAVLLTGAGKADLLRRIADFRDGAAALPIKGILPLEGELRWYLDEAACGTDA